MICCPICGHPSTRILTKRLRRGRGTVNYCKSCDLGYLINRKFDAKEFYDGEYRRVGDEFECHSPSEFSDSWMIKLKQEPEKKTILSTIRDTFKA